MIQTKAVKTSEHHANLFETGRRLMFERQYAAALALLDTEVRLSPALEALRGTLLIFTDDLAAARIALTNALARGYRGALASLSTVQRLEGQRRDGLLELEERDLEGLDDFDQTNLEREIALMHQQHGDQERALEWFERAWRSALTGPFGAQQLAGIAHPLGISLAQLGFDARAVVVFDEGLRHAQSNRRVPMLYERALCHLNLARFESAGEDLEEARVFVPNNPDLALLVRYAEARLQHGLGDLASARANFELALYFSAVHGSTIAHEVALHACLWLSRLDTDAGALEAVVARLERAAGFARSAVDRAWLGLRRGRYLSAQGQHVEATALLTEVVDLFAATGSRRETAIARLHRAEALLRAGTDQLEEADLELIRLAELVRELGTADALQSELVALSNTEWHLEVTQGWPVSRTLLERGLGVTRVRVSGRSLETESGEIHLPANAARLASYLIAHPCSSWSHVRWGVYPEIQTDEKALEMFDAARGELEAVRGVRVVYRAERHAYSLVWEGVSLER